MLRKIAIIALFLNFNLISAQTLIWSKPTGQANDIVYDSKGSIIIVGKFNGTLDLDPGLGTKIVTAIGPSDLYIQKLDSNGDLIWGYSFGTFANGFAEEFIDVALDDNDNIYAVGTFGGSIDFDPSSKVKILDNGNSFSHGGVIVKFNQNGELQLAYGLTSNGSNSYFSGINIKKNSIYITGSYTGTHDFDFNPSKVLKMSSNGWQSWNYTFNSFISRMDLDCNLIWSKQLRTKGRSFPGELTVDNDLNVIVVGQFQDSIDLDPSVKNYLTTSDSYSYDCYVLKLDSIGELNWAKTYGGKGNERVSGLCTDNSNSYYITGTFENEVDFDPNNGKFNLSALNGPDYYLLKLSKGGDFNWCLSNKNFILSNKTSFENNLIFVGGINNAYNSQGTIQYSTNLFPSTSDFCVYNNYIYLCGNLIVNKYSNCSIIKDSILVEGCNMVNVNGIQYNTSGKYYQSFKSSSGCDSILSINVNLKSIDTTIKKIGNTLISNSNNTIYQWVKCDPFTVILGANQQQYIVTASGDYAAILNKNGCLDTSECVKVIITNSIYSNKTEVKCSLFPNPCTDQIQIISNVKINTIVITDLNGNSVYECINPQQYITISELKPAIYIIHCKTENEVFIQKICKQ